MLEGREGEGEDGRLYIDQLYSHALYHTLFRTLHPHIYIFTRSHMCTHVNMYTCIHLHVYNTQEQDNTSQRMLKQSKDGEAQKPRTTSIGEKATEEAELCRKYTDIVTYLAGIQFPVEATRKISQAILDKYALASTADQCGGSAHTQTHTHSHTHTGGAGTGTGTYIDWEHNCYADVGSMYLSRIPFWVRGLPLFLPYSYSYYTSNSNSDSYRTHACLHSHLYSRHYIYLGSLY